MSIKLTHIKTVLILSLLSHSAASQTVQQAYRGAEQKRVAIYSPSSTEVWLPMSFGSSRLTVVPALIDSLKHESFEVLSVSVVFSDYPKGRDFPKLNRARLARVQYLLPQVFKDTTIGFQLVRQTRCNSIEEAKALSHGIAIRYQRIEPKKEGSIAKNTAKEHEEQAEQTPQEEEIIDAIQTEYTPNVEISGAEIGSDSTVLSVLDRRGKSWEGDWVIITDLTYSMAPFTWQVLQWQQSIMEKQSVMAHIFFNDGDKKKDELKTLGSTGGIYASHTQSQDSLVSLMAEVQEAGNGGDIPENDIEVLLYAQEQYPKASNYVLIADAKSSIRDYELLEKLNIPVKVILARTEESYSSIPIQYVELALKTQGSLYTQYYDFEGKEELLRVKAYFEEKQRYYKEAEEKMNKRKKSRGRKD